MSTAFNLEPNLPDEASPIDAQIVTQEDVPLSVEAVTLAGHMGRITAKLNAEIELLEKTGESIAQSVNAITPHDQASYAELCERLEENNRFLKQVDEFAEPWKKLFYRPYKAILDRVSTMVWGPTVSHTNGKQRRLAFEREVKAAEERERARLAAEQKQREEEQRLAAAVQAEESGMSSAAVETILTAPSVAPTPQPAPMISRPVGVRKIAANWQAELEDKAAFWKWARTQKEMPACLLIDQPAMNREAKTHRAMLGQKFPGWRGVNKGGE